ncbi:tetratricopeptide repeat protein, partial [Arthrospira platensis SPKY1]|nr:tetratricopeptide repeat protein [Arthrospira platensis SPKY1]
MSAGELLKQANQLKRSGRLDEAIALYHQVIEMNPHFAWAYSNLGDAFVKQGNLDEAVVQYHRAIEINPKSVFFYINLGRVTVEKYGFNAGIEYFRQAIKIRPDLLYELNGDDKKLFNNIQTPAYDFF